MDYEAVMATNDDAALCKYHAVAKGYYKDPFVNKFLSNRLIATSVGKPPEISLGYYARSVSISYVVEQFIKTNPSCQIISLGAGYDSLYWRLKHYGAQTNEFSTSQFKYIEIDLVEVTSRKMINILKVKELKEFMTSPKRKGDSLFDECYNLISFDLRNSDRSGLMLKLDDCGVDFERPTLCLTECVLVYMPLEESESLIKWLSDNFSKLTMLNYEQCNMEDKFGDIMLSNMTARHCDLMGVEACKSLLSQGNRFKTCKLPHVKIWTLSQIFSSCFLPSEVERVDKIESLDEKELLQQLLDHYCIVIGSKTALDWLEEETYWFSGICCDGLR